MFQTKDVEETKTHIVHSVTFSQKSCCTAREATDNSITQHRPFACYITKDTNTYSKYVILTAFPRQQVLRERASMLHNTHTACLVFLLEYYIWFTSTSWFMSFSFMATFSGIQWGHKTMPRCTLKQIQGMRFEVLILKLSETHSFWDVTPCQ